MDQWISFYKSERPHSGKYCDGRTPDQNFSDTRDLADQKRIDTLFPKEVSLQDSSSLVFTA
ncbi:MAG: hypothetical protein JRF45_08255 [Deltaproteobacteria bacterium]|nr:hypothetical protein [Deltaproteobacteria bacterium]